MLHEYAQLTEIPYHSSKPWPCMQSLTVKSIRSVMPLLDRVLVQRVQPQQVSEDSFTLLKDIRCSLLLLLYCRLLCFGLQYRHMHAPPTFFHLLSYLLENRIRHLLAFIGVQQGTTRSSSYCCRTRCTRQRWQDSRDERQSWRQSPAAQLWRTIDQGRRRRVYAFQRRRDLSEIERVKGQDCS